MGFFFTSFASRHLRLWALFAFLFSFSGLLSGMGLFLLLCFWSAFGVGVGVSFASMLVSRTTSVSISMDMLVFADSTGTIAARLPRFSPKSQPYTRSSVLFSLVLFFVGHQFTGTSLLTSLSGAFPLYCPSFKPIVVRFEAGFCPGQELLDVGK